MMIRKLSGVHLLGVYQVNVTGVSVSSSDKLYVVIGMAVQGAGNSRHSSETSVAPEPGRLQAARDVSRNIRIVMDKGNILDMISLILSTCFASAGWRETFIPPAGRIGIASYHGCN